MNNVKIVLQKFKIQSRLNDIDLVPPEQNVSFVRARPSTQATQKKHYVIDDIEKVVLIVSLWMRVLTHCSQMTHICVSKNSTTGPDNGLAPMLIYCQLEP